MISLDTIVQESYDRTMLCEGGCGGHINHIFEDGNLTFAEIRDIFKNVFQGKTQLSEKVDGLALSITYKDGKFGVARDKKSLKDPMDIAKLTDKYCDKKEVREAFTASVKDLSDALSSLDQVQLNKVFANGQNFMRCEIIYPPCKNVLDYGNKCFLVLHGLDVYNNLFDKVSEDQEQANRLFEMLRKHKALQQETFEITKPNILRIKNSVDADEALASLMQDLEALVKGNGWKCSVNDYVKDRYSSYIVDCALKSGIDVGRNSDFVNELVARLSNVSGRRPTKTDLITYAKKDGIDYKAQNYRDMMAYLEETAAETNAEIIKPVERLCIKAGVSLIKNLQGFMAADPSKTAQKMLSELDQAVAAIEEDETLTPEKIKIFKRNIDKLAGYHEGMPSEGVVFIYKGKPYKMTSLFGPINQITGILRYK